MTETTSLRLGANIARYRKLAGLSAQALADAAGEGLTRSQIADLENRRKRDLSVLQLMAVARVLGVPPVALVSDLFCPGAPAGEWPVVRKTFTRNLVTGLLDEDVDAPFNQNAMRLWFTGQLEYGSLPVSEPAPKAALNAIRDLTMYQRAYSLWEDIAFRLVQHRRHLENGLDFEMFKNEMGVDVDLHEARLIERLRQQTVSLKYVIERLVESGVELPTAAEHIDSALARLNVEQVPDDMLEFDGYDQ